MLIWKLAEVLCVLPSYTWSVSWWVLVYLNPNRPTLNSTAIKSLMNAVIPGAKLIPTLKPVS